MEKGTIKSLHKSCTKARRGVCPSFPSLGQGMITNSPGKADMGPPEGEGQRWGRSMLNGEHPREMPVHHHHLLQQVVTCM